MELSGPVALVVATGACIALALGDYFFGDKIASIFFKEDPEEVKKLLQAKHDKIEAEVLSKAYDLFNLTKFCTADELKEAYRTALLKYHPDKCRYYQDSSTNKTCCERLSSEDLLIS